MIRSTLFRTALIAMVGLSGCAVVPGTVCRDATGRSIENPDYCRIYPARHADIVCHAAPKTPAKS
jgi:hypothetical protein